MNDQPTMMNPQQQQQQQKQMMTMNMNQNQMMMNPPQHQLQNQQRLPAINRSYGMWGPPLQPQMQYQNPNQNLGAGGSGMKPNPSLNLGGGGGSGMQPPFNKSSKPLGVRSNWKGKKVSKQNDKRRTEKQQKQGMVGPSNVNLGGVGNVTFNGYNPPNLNDLQYQNRMRARNFFPKRKFNKNNSLNANMRGGYSNSGNRAAPYAPRNTTSFLIRAKKSGGIASLVSPYPVTPSVLPTPIFSPSREVLVDMAKEEWGVDGYGSMKGLIRLRGHDVEANEEDEEDDGGSSESDVDEHVEVERRLGLDHDLSRVEERDEVEKRLDHDLSRFEMIYDPSSAGGMDYHNLLENRVDDQDTHIAQLEEENLILKERLFLMERELADMRRRLRGLEKREQGEDMNEEVEENESDDESGSYEEEGHSLEENNRDLGDNKVVEDRHFVDEDDGNNDEYCVGAEMNNPFGLSDVEGKVGNDSGFAEADKMENIASIEVEKGKNTDEAFGESKNENVAIGEEKKDNNVEVKEELNSGQNNDVDVKLKPEDNVLVLEHAAVGDVCMKEVGDVHN